MSIESDLLTRALSLPKEDRAELANRLLLSLEPDSPDDDRDAAWTTEIERRRVALERGQTTASPWREAMARIEQSLQPGVEE